MDQKQRMARKSFKIHFSPRKILEKTDKCYISSVKCLEVTSIMRLYYWTKIIKEYNTDSLVNLRLIRACITHPPGYSCTVCVQLSSSLEKKYLFIFT